MHCMQITKARVYLLVFVIIAVYALVPIKILSVRNEEGVTVFKQRVVNGTEFTYRFLHSYDRDWVEETFVIRKSHFNMARHRFRAFTYDARELTYPGDFYFEEGYGVVDNIEQHHETRMEKLDIRVARTVDQYLIVKGEQTSFSDLSQPGDLLTLEIKRQPRVFTFLSGKAMLI